MKQLILVVFILSMLVSPALGALGTYPLNYGTVSNPRELERYLRNRITGLEGAVNESLAAGNRGTGKVFYVDSAVGSDTYTGETLATATATLDAAVALCTANRGDVIYVMQGHAENLAAADAVDIDVAGVTVIGLGEGDLRPTFTYTNAAGEIAIGANNVLLANVICRASVTAVLKAIDIEAGFTDAQILGVDFKVDDYGTDEFIDTITVKAASHRAIIDSCLFDSGTVTNAGPQAGVNFLDCNNIEVTNNVFFGDYAVACIENETTLSTAILIANNLCFNGLSIGGTAGLNAQPGIEVIATTSGVIVNNVIFCNLATPELSIVAADCFLSGNVYNETEGGVDAPPNWFGTDTALNPIGFDDNNNAYASTNVAANADGSILERLEQIDTDTSAVLVDTAELQPAGEKCILASIASIATPDQVLYTVAGGPIKIIEIVGIVTGQIQAQSTLINYNVAVTTPAGDVVFGTDGTALEINGDAAGTLYTWNGVIANDLIATTAGVALGMASGTTTGLIVPPGDIELRSTAASTGTIEFSMRYQPLDEGVTVTAP